MAGFQVGPSQRDPTALRNPYLDEIDAAANNAHATLSPGAQAALQKAGAPLPAAPAPTPQITNPRPMPSMPLPGGVRGNAANNFNTTLSPGEEPQFQTWKSQYAPKDSGEDYDLRGAYKYGLTPSPENGHWSDRFKKPNEPTFSNQSQYAQDAPEKAGSWNGDTYVPPKPAISSPQSSHPVIAPVPVAPTNPANVHDLARLTKPDTGLHNKENTGTAGVNQIHNPWARVPLQILDAIGSGFAPGLTSAIPGTQLHHQALIGGRENALKQDEVQRESQEKAQRNAADIGHLGAEAANQMSQVPLNEARTETQLGKPELNQQAADVRQQQADIAAKKQREDDERLLRGAGYKRDPVTGELAPLPEEELSEPERAKIEQIHAITSLRASQQELADANAALAQARAKNLPQQMQLAEARIATAQRNSQIAMQRLGLSQATYNMRALGEDAQGKPLPGAIIADNGQTVGSVNAANVRPTGTQRTRGDLATSAQHQLEDMRSIVKKHPEFFGPGAGRKTDFNVWLGSEDPDAARFRTARTILGDHEAGTFGGRSDQTVKNLEAAAGLFKTNPDAILGSLEQLEKANTVFKGAGTPKTVGSNRANSQVPEISTKEQYDKLPSGTIFMQDGEKRKKP